VIRRKCFFHNIMSPLPLDTPESRIQHGRSYRTSYTTGLVLAPSAIVWTILLLLICGPTSARVSSGIDAESILRRAAAQYAQRPSILYDSETVVTWPDRELKPGDQTKLRYIGRLIQDKDRIDLTERILETVDSEERPFSNSRNIWDGSMYLHRSKSRSMDSHNASISRESKRASRVRMSTNATFLDGTLSLSGNEHYAKTFLDAAKLTLRGQMEKIKGHPCYVVEASRREGETCTLWIDPAAGFNLRKAVIHRRLTGDPPKAPPGAEIVAIIKQSATVLDDVELEQVGGRWCSTAGTYDLQWHYADGDFHHARYEARRYNTVWNPNFDELGAFKMDLPEGTKLTNRDDRNNQYVWRNGKPEKVNRIHAAMLGRAVPPLAVEAWYNGPSEGLDLKGKVVLLDFFGVWCGPCMAKIPFIKEQHELYSDRGLVVIGVHTAESREKIPEFISDKSIQYAIAVDEQGQNAKLFNVFFYPTVVLIDREGAIRAVNPSELELKDLLENLL
jgi:thiol-disulfide isomerase/thioredoxin